MDPIRVDRSFEQGGVNSTYIYKMFGKTAFNFLIVLVSVLEITRKYQELVLTMTPFTSPIKLITFIILHTSRASSATSTKLRVVAIKDIVFEVDYAIAKYMNPIKINNK